MKRTLFLFLLTLNGFFAFAKSFDSPDTIFVARDGTGEFRTVAEAIEKCRAFMDYTKVIYIKKGVYKEKLVLPSWLTNIEICGENPGNTIITYDDHANIKDYSLPTETHSIGTFRTYTFKVEGDGITFRSITIENNAAPLGQAVALHSEGDRLKFINCRFLGNQDTVYTGKANSHQLFLDCYIEGTTDFIFGPSSAWFENCQIHCKRDSYITAASTPKDVIYGYVFNNCTITIADNVKKVYLGSPWRPYGYTLFMNCSLPQNIAPEGWHNWKNPENEKTARYFEYNNTGAGAATAQRVVWSRLLTKKEALRITIKEVLGDWAER